MPSQLRVSEALPHSSVQSYRLLFLSPLFQLVGFLFCFVLCVLGLYLPIWSTACSMLGSVCLVPSSPRFSLTLWDSSYLLYKNVLELCFRSVAVLRINAKSYTGEERRTTLLGHFGSGPRSFLLLPVPPLIFRDVAKAEREGSPFGRVVCFS